MIVLTPAQAMDLRYLVALYRLTIGLSRQRYPLGDSVRTGRALARKGFPSTLITRIEFSYVEEPCASLGGSE